MPRFRKLQSVKIEYGTQHLTEYISEQTGMRIVVVDQVGPKVLGFFAVATEIHDDSGAPHTLEHLCFMGSKQYPYKGFLDKVATRAYSTTNAWTATDHTAYTLETAGYAAFAQILPMYLDHVIRPTLTDAGCYTEVFHVDGTGHDAGVVYSEMQAVQNTAGERMDLASKRLVYPEGVGFRYETGGMMAQLRSLTADRIRAFHRERYQPRNLCLVLVGEIDHQDLLNRLDHFEESIVSDILDDPGFRRPWIESPQAPALLADKLEVVEFPEEDETMGEVLVRYLGPSANDQVEITALSVLLAYLASSSASVLDNVLVEKEQIASAVYYSLNLRPRTLIEFSLTGVETHQLDFAKTRLLELLRETAEAPLDMAYLHDCLHQERRRQLHEAESSIDAFTSSLIAVFLFSPLRDFGFLGTMDEFEELRRWDEARWKQSLKKWISTAHHVAVLGQPSAALSAQLESEEEQRIEDQIKKLGPDGLEKLKTRLANAKQENDRAIPAKQFEAFPIPNPDSIHFINTVPARVGHARDLGRPTNEIQDRIDQDASSSPLFIQFEHTASKFVTICIVIPTESIPLHLRPLLALYRESFWNKPVLRGGTRIEFEDVVKGLERDLVHYAMGSASALGNGEMLQIVVQAEMDKYATAIEYVREIIWDGIFDLDRLKATTSRMLADVPEEKRSGDDMISAVNVMISHAPESIPRASTVLVRGKYLRKIKHLLDENPEQVINQLKELNTHLQQVAAYRVLVIGDTSLPKPVSSWNILAHKTLDAPPPLDRRLDRLSAVGRTPGNTAYVVPMATIDSSFALAQAKGLDRPDHPRTAALSVAIGYLDAVEGPMWEAIRGSGLAYGTGFRRRIGHTDFSIYRSPNAAKAFQVARSVVEGFVSGTIAFEQLAMEGAISSIILGVANAQSTMAAAATDNFVKTVMNNLPRDWNEILLEQVRKVTYDDVRDAMRDLLLPIFDATSSNLVVTCAPVMEEGMVQGFNDMGFKPKVQPLNYFQDDYGLDVDTDESDSESVN